MPDPASSPAMLEISGLKKVYNGKYALGTLERGVDLSIREGELFALLGPSGCGKTTTLKIVGGFASPSAGQVRIAGEDVTHRAPYARPTNTVFQNYALFPHMSVVKNLEYGLKVEGVAAAERRARAIEALGAIAMTDFADRRIADLSGGQQQRVALARALVKRPKILLLDEPLGAIDLAMRKRLQEELVRIKLATGLTMVHVTHDQEEACAIADRIAVMNKGRVVQIDRPIDLYRRPRTAFVANFLGVGTVFQGKSSEDGGQFCLETQDARILSEDHTAKAETPAALIRDDKVSIRLGHIDTSAGNSLNGIIDQVQFTGSRTLIFVKTASGRIMRASLDAFSEGENYAAHIGAKANLSWSTADVLMIDDDL